MSMPRVGDEAPDFELLNQRGENVKLSSLRGKYVVLYFYPKDFTHGCTLEAQSIKDVYDELKELKKLRNMDVIVLGVSADSVESHKRFAETFNLPFNLLSDPDKKVINLYGVKGLVGARRVTFIIDKDGRIVKIFPKVNAAQHGKEVLNALQELLIGS
ncbi:MAG: peroxiredoxin [Thermoprotei archaeon]